METNELSVDAVDAVDALMAERPLREISSLVSLNFKVSLKIRLQFKIYAAEHNMTMTELLLHLFNARLSADADQNCGISVRNNPIESIVAGHL